MYFRHFHLHNFGPFDNLAVDLQRGSVGIFGPNGRGKSTFVNAMYACLTNDFGRFDGVKIQCIRNTAKDADESYLYGEVEHNGHVLKITRSLRPSATIVVVDDNKPITNTNKANEAIDEVLGITGDMLDLYVFKTQDRIYDFLSTTPGERAKAFSILCRTEKCEDIHSALNTFLNKDGEVNAQIVDDSDELLSKIAQLEETKKEYKNNIDNESKLLMTSASMNSAKEILRRQDRVEDLLEEKPRIKTALEAATTALESAEAKLKTRRSKVEELSAKVKATRPKVVEAMSALKTLEQHKKRLERYQTLLDQAESLQQEAKLCTAPKPPKSQGDLGKLRKELQLREHEYKASWDIVNKFETEGDGSAACPTCGTPIAEVEAHLAKHKKIVANYEAWEPVASANIEALEGYEQAARRYEKWKAAFDAKLKANQDALESAKVGDDEPVGNEKALKKLVQEFEEMEGELQTAKDRYTQSMEARSGYSAQRDAAEKRLDEINQAIAENKESEDRVAKARQRLDEHAAATNNIARANGAMQGIVSQIEMHQESLAKLKAKLKRSKKIRRGAEIVGDVCDLVHRTGLPKDVAKINLSRMEGDINEGLEHYGSPFWVESDESLSFVVHKPGEPPQPSGRLSTGQRVIVALAFWPAVASLWSQDLGILALDEPTANLDEENRKLLSQALGELTAKVRGKRQLIMVTHDQNLRTAFDQVIDIGGIS
jgi:DNA repair exonuclease SbcCD ATPase subunit